MKSVGKLVVWGILWSLLAPLAVAERDLAFSLPPESLRQWYKPVNERQVWLHTMFGLRRSMQAIQEYVALEDSERLEKWSGRFLKNYRSLTRMVPEWSDGIELDWADRLEQAVAAREWSAVGRALKRLGTTCRSCHREYRAVTAALYRAPDFSTVEVEDSETLEGLHYDRAMTGLVSMMNRFKIAAEDQRGEAAADYLQQLDRRLGDLGESCSHCHGEDPAPRERILGAETARLMSQLSQQLESGSEGLGVKACARCHGVHRTLSDLRLLMLP